MMQTVKKWIVMLLVVSMLGSTVAVLPASAAEGGSTDGDWVYDTDSHASTNTYYYYIQKHQNAGHPEKEVAVDVTQFRVEESQFGESGTKLYENTEGSEKGVYIGAKGEKVIFTVEVPKTGLYCIEMNYFPLSVSNSQYLFGLLIDGETPFTEANSCMLSRVFENEPIRKDEKTGDDLRPQATQTPEWRKQFLYDQTGTYGSLNFYLEQGKHEIALCFDGTPLLLEGITFKQEPYLMSYQDYISVYKQKGYKEAENVLKLYQGENYYKQSHSQLWPSSDKSSCLTQPFDYDHIRINYGGGSQWKQPGQWISWKIDVPEDGFYNLGYKYRQSYLDGLFSSRKIYIDGEVPFAELSAVRFNYSDEWKNQILGDGTTPYSIYLTKGEHIITMENVVGDLADTMGVLRTVIAKLNDLYLSVVMITSSDPDPYRDYYLDKQLPNLKDELKTVADQLFAEADRLEQIVGKKGAENAYFDDVAYNLVSYAENLNDLTYKGRLTNFKNDINGLSAKLSAYQEQALDIDYFALVSSDAKMPKTAMNFWQWLVFQVRSFFTSFKDKNNETDEDTKSIRVWISSGIDQFEILKNMIVDEFTADTGIRVDLELAQGSLINALAAGTGPDVMIGIGSDTVVNLALRGAVVDLSQFDGFETVLGDYIEGSEIPFTLEGQCFGVPNTHGCTVMFIRTDIFESMGLGIPQSWDDIYDVAQVLQRYNMSLGAVPSFANLLYQNGGNYFNDDLTEVMFDSEVAVNALVQHTEFFTKYGFPISYDFTNRFRTGEMPIGIADYSLYNTLKYTAPEISGLWDMYLVPGTLMSDGSINRTQMDQSGTGVVMLRDAKDQDSAWEFIEWWSGHEAQTRYAIDVESTMGIAARYATANKKTIRELGWTTKELSILENQFSYLKFIPIVPGNYYVTRGLNNSIRGVVDNGENARELLTEWTIKINEEILRKRNEFFLNN